MKTLLLTTALLVLAQTAFAVKPTPVDKLTPLQRHVTQEGGTERAFDNAYWNHREEGIYVDIISGKPLFSSTDKFDSGTGWPSFTKPIDTNVTTTHTDNRFGMERTEIKSESGAHLGHVFDDGPKDKGGKRYCINSAALRFVPKAQPEAEGYGQYLPLFGEKPTAKSTTAKPAVLPTAKLIALYFYADWCGNCKQLAPKLQAARKTGQLDRQPIAFITLDLTNPDRVHQSLLLAQALGVGSYVQQQGSATGYLALLDAKTHKEIARFDSSSSETSIRTGITKALRPR